MAIESLYDRIGGMGRFQWMTSILIALCQVPAGWSMLQMSFAGVIPDFYCLILGEDGDDSIVGAGQEMETESEMSGMWKYYKNESTLNECSINGSSCDRYVYDTSADTIVTDWGLVCDMKWTKKVIISIQMAGVLLGAIMAGQFSDVFGRKKVLYSFAFVHFVLNIVGGVSVSWVMFACLRFFIGMCIGAIIVVVTPFQMEFLPVKWRPLLGVIPSFTLGLTIFAGAAALLENWAQLHFACAAVSFFSLIGVFFIPESPRWLVVQGRVTEAEEVINRIARVNRKAVPSDVFFILQSMTASFGKSSEKAHRYTYVDLFKRKYTAKLSLTFFYYWFVLATVYYGISFGVGSFVGNLYLNIFLLGVMEIPVQITTFFLNNSVGRRNTTLLFLILSFLPLLGCLLFHQLSKGSTEKVAINVLSLIAKMMIGAAWSSIHIWGTESFPTVMRNLGCGFSTLGARVGGILAPFVIDLDEMMSASYGILCILLAVGTIVAFIVPDTKGKVLKDHVKGQMNGLVGDYEGEKEIAKLSGDGDNIMSHQQNNGADDDNFEVKEV